MEYSLWSRDAEMAILPVLRELGIGFVGYCPLGRGFLTASFQTRGDLLATDRRHDHPRFQEGNFERNLELLDPVKELAEAKGCKPAQVALAWVLAQGEDIVPIPGTKRRKYLEENVAALEVTLSRAEIDLLEQTFQPGVAAGLRYPAFQLEKMGI
jgi:aryl-alcohol dehydrogenase-like predicted oxidoreductase